MSYAIGDVGTWLAWRLMDRTRAALADNLRALFPDEPNGDARAAGARDAARLRA